MEETLEMMKSILLGKEKETNEKELIALYKRDLCPNILAYFFVANYGLICKTAKLYPKLDNDDKASFCLQELDKCLQLYNVHYKVSFMTYFIKCYTYRLNNELKLLMCDKRKALLDSVEFESLKDIGINDCADNFDIIYNNYNLTPKEKIHCNLRLAGYTIKEISKLLKISASAVSQQNKKIKQKINILT